jgi:hypothetical protein
LFCEELSIHSRTLIWIIFNHIIVVEIEFTTSVDVALWAH